ncbi:MAG: hypothetical protein ACRDRJ_09215 [Streptosporangiaceae bacterium]
MATTKVILSGPLFDGTADAAARDFVNSLAAEVAAIGRDWIKLDTQRMDKSGRGGTGAAAGGVQLTGSGGSYTISGGIRKGEYAWPWLEGTSKRNESTGFKGYHTFRRTRLRMRTQVTPFAQAQMEKYITQMGGAAR